jgi:NADPH2:quinone reductase
MEVAAFASLTGPGGIELLSTDSPTPGPGEAVVEVRASSLNRHDLWILEGTSSQVSADQLPFVSGLDLAGVVRETGAETTVTPGDRVALCPIETCGTCEFCRTGPENRCESFSLYHGAFAEMATVDASRLVHLPDELSFREAAALPTAYLTAWHMLEKADVTTGDLLFVPGTTGGVGVAVVQLANVLGARTVGTSTSARKLKRLEAVGCDYTIHTADPEEMVEKVGDIGPVDATLNHLAGEFTDVGLRVQKRDSVQVVCGDTADPYCRFEAAPFFFQHQTVVGSTMGTQPELKRLVDLVAAGAFDPEIDETYPLAELDEAFIRMQERSAFGKLVVEP